MRDEDLYAEVPVVDEHASRALTAAQKWVGGDVAGVAIGETEDGSPCVVVYATDPSGRTGDRLPSSVEGLPVRVIGTDPFSAQSE